LFGEENARGNNTAAVVTPPTSLYDIPRFRRVEGVLFEFSEKSAPDDGGAE